MRSLDQALKISLIVAGLVFFSGFLIEVFADTPTVAPPAPVAIDEHEGNGGIEEPTPDPIPNACCLPACTMRVLVNDCYGCRWLSGWCSEGEVTCWVSDPCQGVCFEVQRPRCCLPICVCSPCSCVQCSHSCGAAAPRSPGCGCGATKGSGTVPILTSAPASCHGGTCPVPSQHGGGVVTQRANTGRRGFILQRHNPNYFGDNATGSGNRIVNIFGRQIVEIHGERMDGYLVGNPTYDRTNTQTQSEPKRKGLFGRRR